MAVLAANVQTLPLQDGVLVLKGRGRNGDVHIPVGEGLRSVAVEIGIVERDSGNKLADIAGAYNVGYQVIAGQYSAYLDAGRVVISPAGKAAMRAATRRFN